MCIIQENINNDVAESIINYMKVQTLKKRRTATGEEKRLLNEEFEMYAYEQRALHQPDSALRRSIIDKAIHLYAPTIKQNAKR